MDEAATTWIAPYCAAYQGPDSAPGVWVQVLNPADPFTEAAQVTVRFYQNFSTEPLGKETKTIEPMASAVFVPDVPPSNAWCHVQSDKPVFPFGITAWQDGHQQGVVHMTFYRHEPPQIQIPIIKDLAGLISSSMQAVTPKPRQSIEPSASVGQEREEAKEA